MIQSYRVPTWLEQSANALGVDLKAVELHERLNGALEQCDVMDGLRVMRELNQLQSVGNRPQIHTIEVRHEIKCATDRTGKTTKTPIEPSRAI